MSVLEIPFIEVKNAKGQIVSASRLYKVTRTITFSSTSVDQKEPHRREWSVNVFSQIVVLFETPMLRRSKRVSFPFGFAFSAIRKGHVCEEGVQALTDKEPQSTDKEERKGRRTNADEDKRKKRRRDEGRRDGARNRRRNRKNDNRRSENSNSARRRNRDTNPVF